MRVIKERTYTKKILSFFIGLLVGWILYLFVMTMVLPFNEPDGTLPDNFGLISLILSLVTMIIYSIISEFNYLKRLELTTQSLLSNITIFKKREKKLLSKADAVIHNFLQHESDVHKSVSASRGGTNPPKNGADTLSLSDLKVTFENYPELKSDYHIAKILNQIEESQNMITNSKLTYNQYVTYYNSAICNFPAIMFSGLWKLKPLSFFEDYNVDDEDDLPKI